MPSQTGFAVAYGVKIKGGTLTIQDDATTPNTLFKAHLTQSADMRSEGGNPVEILDAGGEVATQINSGSRRTLNLTLVPTNGAAGATGGIALAEDQVVLPDIGTTFVLGGFMGPGTDSGEINGSWKYRGNGRVVTANNAEVRIEIELERVYNSAGSLIDLTETD